LSTPVERQPKFGVILQGTGKRIAKEEREELRAAGPDIACFWQKNAWATEDVMAEWVEDCWKPFVGAVQNLLRPGDTFMLLQDNLKAHYKAKYVDALKGAETFPWYLPSSTTESTQMLDQGFIAIVKSLYTEAQDAWLEKPDNLAKWEGATPFSARERRLHIVKWLQGAINSLNSKIAENPHKYGEKYWLRTGSLITLTGEGDDEIHPQAFPNFKVPRERWNPATSSDEYRNAQMPSMGADESEDEVEDDVVSDTESEFDEPTDEVERLAFRAQRGTTFEQCLQDLPDLFAKPIHALQKRGKKAKWKHFSKEEIEQAGTTTGRKGRVPAVDEQGRLTSWFSGSYIVRLHNEEGWVHALLGKCYPDGLKRGPNKGCNFLADFLSGSLREEKTRCIHLSMDRYDDSGTLTLDAGAWCVVYPNWDETDELDVVKDVPDDE